MRTPFGELAVVDAHAHFFSHRFFTTLAAALPESTPVDTLGERLGFDLPSEDPEALAKRWVEELDRHGLARSVLIASVPGDEESVAAAARAFPERFIPYFMLNPRAADALARTKRAFRELGMKGLCLFPAMHHFHVWDDALRPILEEAAAAGAIVFVHCGVLKVGVRDKLGLSSPFDLRFASPVDLSGVAKTFDTVPFVVPHFGSGFFRELLLVADECANVYTDTSSSNAWASRLPTPLTLAEVLARSLAVLGAERLLYGSDSSFFPRGWQKDQFQTQIRALEELNVTRDQAAAILGGNLTRLVSGSENAKFGAC